MDKLDQILSEIKELRNEQFELTSRVEAINKRLDAIESSLVIKAASPEKYPAKKRKGALFID